MVGCVENVIRMGVWLGMREVIVGLFVGERVRGYSKFEWGVVLVVLRIICMGIEGII